MLENTVDKECLNPVTYDCGGSTNSYCFAYVSPNTSLDADGNLQ